MFIYLFITCFTSRYSHEVLRPPPTEKTSQCPTAIKQRDKLLGWNLIIKYRQHQDVPAIFFKKRPLFERSSITLLNGRYLKR
jgi:hypothetical protein